MTLAQAGVLAVPFGLPAGALIVLAAEGGEVSATPHKVRLGELAGHLDF